MENTQFRLNTHASWKFVLSVSIASLSLFCAKPRASAAGQNWNPAAPSGVGNWDLVTANWDSSALWTNGNTAAFAGTPAVVTVAPGGVTASGIIANTGIYVITGGPIALAGISPIETNADLTINSVLTGYALNKTGGSALLLGAQSTYVGATNVAGGVLRIGLDQALPSTTTLTVTGASSTFDLNGHNQTVAGLSLQNGGTLDDLVHGGSLTSTSSYDLRDGQVFASLRGNVGLNKSDFGTVLLYGANTYTGPTNVTDGILREAGANALPSTTVLSVDGATAVNDLNGYSQTVTGVAVKHGGWIADTFGGASLTSLTAFDAQDGKISAILAGAVGLNKTTAGTVTLSARNTYTGLTQVSAGTLLIDGGIAGDARITGGALGGNGAITGNVRNQGTVNPGYGVGALTIGGNYTQTSTGALNILLTSPTSYGHLVVGGAATLAGSLKVSYSNGFAPGAGDRFTIITAKRGVTGGFNQVNTGTVLNLNVNLQPNSVVLEFTQGSFSRPSWEGFSGYTHNQQQVATALDALIGNARTASLITFLDQQAVANLPHDLDLIAPEELASLFDLSIGAADVQAANLEHHFEEIRAGSSSNFSSSASCCAFSPKDASKSPVAVADDRWGWFASGNGSFLSIGNGSNGVAGYDLTTSGMTVGLDYRFAGNLTLGVVAGYLNSSIDLTGNGRIGVNGGQGGIYAAWSKGGLYLNGAVTGGGNSYDIRRTGLGGSVLGNTTGSQFDSLLSGGFDLHANHWTFGPTADVEYTWVGVDAFDEHGSLAPLHIQNNEASSLRSRIGLRATYDADIGGVRVTPELRAAWQHEYLDNQRSISASFVDGGVGAFTVGGPAIGRDSLTVIAGVTVQISKQVSIFADYDGNVGRTNYSSHSVIGGVRVKF